MWAKYYGLFEDEEFQGYLRVPKGLGLQGIETSRVGLQGSNPIIGLLPLPLTLNL